MGYARLRARTESWPVVHRTGRRGEAAIRTFAERQTGDDSVVGLAVLARRRYPESWAVAWVTASGEYRAGHVAITAPVVSDGASYVGFRPANGCLTTREPGLMMFAYFARFVKGDFPLYGRRDNFGFVRGAAKVEGTWDGAPAPVTVVPLGLADDPGLCAVLLETPSAPRLVPHSYTVTAYDASGAEVGRSTREDVRL